MVLQYKKKYKYAPGTGCTECKKIIASKTHTGKIISKETRSKIGQKASQRPGSLTGKFGETHPRFKGGSARDDDFGSKADYNWKNAVRKRCKDRCVITGIYATSNKRHQCHHLYSFDSHKNLRYEPLNGIY